MKKKLFFLAVAAVALASCSNDETIASQATSQANEISFRPLMTGVTRAANQSFTQTTTNKTFTVTAFETGGETSKYFGPVQFKSNGTSFNSEKAYYWPNSTNLDFYAFTPDDGASATLATTSATGNQITPDATYGYKKFTVIPSSVVASQVDLVFANTNNWGKSTTSQTTGHVIPTANGVTINFRHTGAKITIKLKNTSETLAFDVQAWKLANVDGEAVYTYTCSTDNGEPSTEVTNTEDATSKYLKLGDWSEITSEYQTIDYATADVTTTNAVSANMTTAKYIGTSGLADAADENFSMILIPQSTTAVSTAADAGYSAKTANAAITSGSYLGVKMTIRNQTNSTGTVVADCTADGKWAIWPVAFNWKPGYSYTYTIDLAGGGYWETNINGSETDNKTLDQVLEGTEIKFVTVSVDSWVDGGNTDVNNNPS